MRAPDFWKDKASLFSALLHPAALLHGWLATRRTLHRRAGRVSAYVICVGNLVAGGAGKTPVALAIGELLKNRGAKVHFLSRGYRGKLRGPVQVDLTQHDAYDTGDEPLLLAELLPTWIARDRLKGALAACAAGAETIIMDDGFQNPALHKHVSLVVVDGGYGFGNERMMPAGPLREPIAVGLSRAQAIVLVGEDTAHASKHFPPGVPVLHARIAPYPEAFALKDKTVIAFAGIARPRKFYRTLQETGAHVREMIAFPDHHFFNSQDITNLHAKAKAHGAQLVTTTKDYARLKPKDREGIISVPVHIVFEDEAALLRILS